MREDGVKRKIEKLEDELRRISAANEEIDNKYRFIYIFIFGFIFNSFSVFRITLSQLDKQSDNLVVLRCEKLELEKSLTVLRHDLKEVGLNL